MDKKDFVRKLIAPWFLLNLAGMAVVLVLFLWGMNKWMDTYTRHDKSVEVPNVVGFMEDDALKALEDVGLRPSVVRTEFREGEPAGRILEQYPPAGNNVKDGREIFLTVTAKETPTTPFPNIIDNSSYREARAKLEGLGFRNISRQDVQGDPDWVIAAKCNGRYITNGQRVTIYDNIVLEVGAAENSEPSYDEWEDPLEDETENTDDNEAESEEYEEEVF